MLKIAVNQLHIEMEFHLEKLLIFNNLLILDAFLHFTILKICKLIKIKQNEISFYTGNY